MVSFYGDSRGFEFDFVVAAEVQFANPGKLFPRSGMWGVPSSKESAPAEVD
jgi:hypothetical protein